MTFDIHRHVSLPSTMDEAKRLARAGAAHGTVVVAEEQTKGRGTSGHTWASPKGGLYLSIVLRDVAEPRLVTLALGVAVAEALEVAGVEPRLKWVNDIWLNDKKVGGILVEAESVGSKVDFMVAGMGLNVNGSAATLPADVRGLATTVEEVLGCDSCIPDLETLLLQTIERWLGTLASEPGAVIAAWRQRDALLGRNVTVDGKPAGQAQGIDERGHLRVSAPPRVISTGRVMPV